MLRRLRKLRLSLAAKCQLLFGAAGALIIAAALWVPWQRMEQLTAQINQRAASQLARKAVLDHVNAQLAVSAVSAGSATATVAEAPRRPRPTTAPVAAASPPSGISPLVMRPAYVSSRLIGIPINEPLHDLTPFESSAIKTFQQAPDRESLSREYQRQNVTGYRYAEPLFLRGDCIQCHAANAPGPIAARAGRANTPNRAPSPLRQPATRPARLLGIVSVDMPSQIGDNQLMLNRVFILTAGLLAGTLAVVVLYLIITGLILKPVRVLQETAQKVSEGDLNIRSDISSGDEFQQLSETFNTMLANLKASEDQLRAVNKSLDLKLDQLAQTNVALYESNRLKSEFLANVSHELRTPLNSILGFAELLRDAVVPGEGKAAPDAKAGRYVQNILSSGQNLLDLINDLLDLAKIEAGRMEVRAEPLSLSDVFEGLANLLKPLCETRRLTIESSVASDVPIIATDSAKLQQILYNFLSNAIKFSPPDAKIELAAQRDGPDAVRISVTDQGPGIEPGQHTVIFEKFRQLDGSVTREHGGSGLGLSISKELITLLGGSIGVRSAPGQGATFWITLPLNITPGPRDLKPRPAAATSA